MDGTMKTEAERNAIQCLIEDGAFCTSAERVAAAVVKKCPTADVAEIVRIGRQVLGLGKKQPVSKSPKVNVQPQEPTMPPDTKPKCAVTGCTNPAKTRGVCNSHYIYQLNGGDPDKRNAIRTVMLAPTTGRNVAAPLDRKPRKPRAPRSEKPLALPLADAAAAPPAGSGDARNFMKLLVALGVSVLPFRGGFLAVCVLGDGLIFWGPDGSHDVKFTRLDLKAV
jgi:hypothetical protein